MNIGIDHGYYAIKTRHFSFPAGISEYSHEPYTLQNTLEYGGKFFVCGTGRQPILRNKMENDNYFLLTLAAIAKEIKQRSGTTECSVKLAAGLPLAGFGREKKPFREYLLRSSQPVCFKSSSPDLTSREEPEQKPSVKKQLQEIKQEQAKKKEEKAKQQDRQHPTPGHSRKKKKKQKGR